jgi:hypothetical protein
MTSHPVLVPGGDGEDALWDAHLPEKGVEAALLGKLVEPKPGSVNIRKMYPIFYKKKPAGMPFIATPVGSYKRSSSDTVAFCIAMGFG